MFKLKAEDGSLSASLYLYGCPVEMGIFAVCIFRMLEALGKHSPYLFN